MFDSLWEAHAMRMSVGMLPQNQARNEWSKAEEMFHTTVISSVIGAKTPPIKACKTHSLVKPPLTLCDVWKRIEWQRQRWRKVGGRLFCGVVFMVYYSCCFSVKQLRTSNRNPNAVLCAYLWTWWPLIFIRSLSAMSLSINSAVANRIQWVQIFNLCILIRGPFTCEDKWQIGPSTAYF